MTAHAQYPAIDVNGKLTRASRLGALIGAIIIPALATIVAIVLAFRGLVTWVDLMLFVVMYCLTAFGVTIGYHRLLAHRGFKAARPLRLTLAVAGSLAFEGSVIGWVANHRRHHAV